METKTKAGAEAGRRRGARSQNQTLRDNTSTFRLHRRNIAPLGAGWRGSWQGGLQEQRR